MSYARMLRVGVLAIFVGESASISAQPGMGKYQQLYTTGSVETLKGVVQSVYLDTPPGVRTQAVYLSLKTEATSIPVQLGPEWFVQKLPTKFEKGDAIEVTGSKVSVEGKTLVLAAQIKKGAQSTAFRNSSGVPVWSGQ